MKKLNIFGPVNSLGYGVVTKNLVLNLFKKGVHITLNPVYGSVEISSKEEQFVFQACYDNVNKFDIRDPSLMIWHAHEMNIFTGTPRIGMPIFEITEFNDREKNQLGTLDHIAVMSNWAKDIVERQEFSRDKKIFVIPGGVNFSIFNPSVQPHQAFFASSGMFTFISSGKYERIRKGHSLVLRAFTKAFSDSPKTVRLMCHWANPFMAEIDQLFANTMNKLEFVKAADSRPIFTKGNMIIEYVPRFNLQEEMSQVYACADAGVFPFAAEGWNLPLIELMAMGKPCIATNYSGPTEYLTDDNALLLKNFDMEVPFDERWFPYKIGLWAKPSEEELIDKMVYVVDNYEEAKKKGDKATRDILTNFTWEKSALKVIDMLNDI